jgi:hypothetical protein
MAVNINIGTSRQEGHAPENFEETAEQSSEQDLSAQPQLSEQSGQPASGQSTEHQTEPPPALPPSDENIPMPAFARYGLGDTVILGRPDYANNSRNGYATINDEREPPEPRDSIPAITEPLLAVAAPVNPARPSAIPMPKPGGIIVPGASNSSSTPVAPPSPIIPNAPRIAGQAVRQALADDQRSSQASGATGTAPTASDAELESIDAMLADPINKQLIDLAKQNMGPAPINNAVADAQIKQYGEARFQDMMYLHRELPSVQNAYAQAVTEAYLANSQPALTANLTNNQGIATPPSTFDINAFTKEYASRSDLMAQAFAAKFGGVPVTQEAGFSGTVSSGDSGGDRSGAYVPVFNVGNLFSVSMNAVFPTGYADGQEGSPPTYFASRTPNTIQQYVLGQDIGDHRAMFDDKAVWFDPSLGFVTDPQNLKDDEESHFDRVMGVVGPIVLTGILAAAGAEFLIGPQGSAVLGFTADSWQAGAIRGAVQAGVGTLANSAVTGRPLTLADLGRSIFTGGVMGGLVNYANLDTYGITTQNGVQVINWGERLTAILGRGTMQGILQQVTGGRFQDGLRNGLISSVSNELSRNLNTEINRWAAENNVDPFIASQLRMVGQGFTSALVRTAANGGQGGVEAFLSDLINGQIGAAGDAERAEINQLTTQYTVAVATNDYTTQATILNDLTERWMNNHLGDTRALALAQVTAGLGWTVDAVHLTQDGNGYLTLSGETIPAELATDHEYAEYQASQQRRADTIKQFAEDFKAKNPGFTDAQALDAATALYDRRHQEDNVLSALNITPATLERLSTGSELADQLVAGVQFGGRNAIDTVKGVYSLAELGVDSWLAVANAIIGDEVFADSAARNQARSDAAAMLLRNADNLPEQLTAHVNRQLARANELDAIGDSQGAARIRADLIGGFASMVLQPGKKPAGAASRATEFERVAQETRATIREKIPLTWAEREAKYVNGDKGWDRHPTGHQDAGASLRSTLGDPPAGMDKPEAHHLLGFSKEDIETQKLFNQSGISPNSFDNGVYLPKEVHQLTFGRDRIDYSTWIEAQFKDMKPGAAVRARCEEIKEYLRTLKPGDVPVWRKR